MISILRVASPAGLLTADAFEALFQQEFPAVATVRTVSSAAALAVLGPLANPTTADHERAAVNALLTLTESADFVCFGHATIPYVPRLLALRNAGRMPWRLLLIAHTAVTYAREWLLLRDLLVPGDCIVAPGASAAAMITALDPALTPWLHVIPHPVRSSPPSSAAPRDTLVTLGRIHADKLLHRVIDAYAMLHHAGRTLPPLHCYGSLDDGRTTGPSVYARSLQARIARLGVQDRVFLAGPVTGVAKAEVLARARVVINLSVSLEEACPKTPLEAQAAGAPVLATQWLGNRDVVGASGILVPVRCDESGAWDVQVDDVATGLARLLDAPPSDEAIAADARAQAPDRQLAKYARLLADASAARVEPHVWPEPWSRQHDRSAAPTNGLLGTVGVLAPISRAQAWRWYLELTDTLRNSAGAPFRYPPTDAEVFWAAVARAAEFAAAERAAGHQRALPHTPRRLGMENTLTSALQHAMVVDLAVESRVGAAFDLLARGAAAEVRAAWPDSHERVHPLVAYLHAELADRTASPVAALTLARRAAVTDVWRGSDAQRVRQFARLCRHAGEAAAAIPWLDEWLARWPDERESGSIWLDLALCHVRGDTTNEDAVRHALFMASTLLGEVHAVDKVRAEWQWRTLSSAQPGQLSAR
jgi:glycosyltransferase involved in cell wall biosynthesis